MPQQTTESNVPFVGRLWLFKKLGPCQIAVALQGKTFHEHGLCAWVDLSTSFGLKKQDEWPTLLVAGTGYRLQLEYEGYESIFMVEARLERVLAAASVCELSFTFLSLSPALLQLLASLHAADVAVGLGAASPKPRATHFA